ncbi:MAG: stalk domain-containing protein [Defluviitaleaceae bacterium]|nr:stalk domain-containing protein [Defluviitaleaceae bacterium]
MKKQLVRFFAIGLALLMAGGWVQPVSGMDIAAQAAIVIDFDTGEILFERDAHTPRVPASMTKAMTAFVVYEEIEAGNLSLETLIPISANASRVSRDTGMQGAVFPLDAGTYHRVDTLLHLAMLPSSNGACVALAEFISGTEADFARRMNESAAAIGMWSDFTNAHGALPHYTNAYSVGRLVYEFIHRYPDILRITGAAYYVFEGQARNNTNQFLTIRPFEGADGFRTGTTREAGACLAATAYRNGRRIIVVVMNAPNNDRRYSDSATLLEFGFAEAARRDAARAAERTALRQAIEINVIINGQTVDFAPLHGDAFPRVVDGISMVPATATLEALDISGYYARGVITISVAGALYTVTPQEIEGEIFIPLRDVAELLGRTVEWNNETRTAIIG